MADFLQKYTLVNGTAQTIDASKSDTIGYDFTNDSPFDVDIQWGLGKPKSFTIPPTVLWRGASPLSDLLIPGNQWSGIIIATPSYPAGGTPPSGAPAMQLTVHGYAKGNVPAEQVIPLNRLQNIGNTVATVGLTNYFDVKNPSYGALGDGVTDDTAAIQSAISAAQAAGGGVVYFPVGIYLVHLTQNPNVASIYAALHLPSHVSLLGDGPRSSTIKLANNAAMDQQSIITNYNPQSTGTDTQIHAQDIGLDGNAANQTTGASLSACDGFKFQYVRDILLQNVVSKNNIGTTGGGAGPSGLDGESHQILIYHSIDVVLQNSETYGEGGNNVSSGIALSDSFNVDVDNCTSRDMTYGGGFPVFRCTHLKMTNCHAYSTASNGYLFEQAQYCTIANCHAGAITPNAQVDSIAANTVFTVSRGFSCQSAKDMQFVGCLVYGATVDGYQTKIAASDPGVNCQDINYIGCMAQHCTGNGWSIEDATQDVTWEGSVAEDNGAAGFYIPSTDSNGRFLLTGTRGSNNGTYGYKLDSTPLFVHMSNCEGQGNTSGALNVAGTVYSKLDGNLGNPAVPATGVALNNPFPFPMTVVVTGGAVSAIAIDSASQGITSGTVRVPMGKSITLTYSSAPTWHWISD